MLFILNIIKNNHAQGENTKESIFALFCLQEGVKILVSMESKSF